MIVYNNSKNNDNNKALATKWKVIKIKEEPYHFNNGREKPNILKGEEKELIEIN